MKKNEILYKLFQTISTNEMDIENQEDIYCPEDDEYRV